MHPVLRLYEDVLSSAESVAFRLPPLPRFSSVTSTRVPCFSPSAEAMPEDVVAACAGRPQVLVIAPYSPAPAVHGGAVRKPARIAAGSGTSVQQVNQLVKQFDQMRKLMRQLGRGKMPDLGALMRELREILRELGTFPGRKSVVAIAPGTWPPASAQPAAHAAAPATPGAPARSPARATPRTRGGSPGEPRST